MRLIGTSVFALYFASTAVAAERLDMRTVNDAGPPQVKFYFLGSDAGF
jgi:hypothetical protein